MWVRAESSRKYAYAPTECDQEDAARVIELPEVDLSPACIGMQTPQIPAGNAMGGWGPIFGHLQDSMASLVEPSLVWSLRGLGRPQNPSPATLRAAGIIGVALLYLLLSLLLAALARLELHCLTSTGAPMMPSCDDASTLLAFTVFCRLQQVCPVSSVVELCLLSGGLC